MDQPHLTGASRYDAAPGWTGLQIGPHACVLDFSTLDTRIRSQLFGGGTMARFTTPRAYCLSIAVSAMACLTVPPAAAQKYPAQTVRVIVPTSPGGAVDAFGRGV